MKVTVQRMFSWENITDKEARTAKAKELLEERKRINKEYDTQVHSIKKSTVGKLKSNNNNKAAQDAILREEKGAMDNAETLWKKQYELALDNSAENRAARKELAKKSNERLKARVKRGGKSGQEAKEALKKIAKEKEVSKLVGMTTKEKAVASIKNINNKIPTAVKVAVPVTLGVATAAGTGLMINKKSKEKKRREANYKAAVEAEKRVNSKSNKK